MIDKTSRYAKTGTYTAEDAEGEPLEALELRAASPAPPVLLHTPVQAERLDHLAWRYLRDPRAFWRICDASDELDPFDVVHPGRPVRIPSIE